MTTTQDIFEQTNSTESKTDETIEVEIWGPPGNGKSVLIVSMIETLRSQGDFLDFRATRAIQDLRRILLSGQQTPVSRPKNELDQTKVEGEYVVFKLPTKNHGSREIRVTANAGEDLRGEDGDIDVNRFVKKSAGKVFVACLNPFKIDAPMAKKALRHLIAVHQGRGMNLPDSFTYAVWTLFQISQDELSRYPTLTQLLSIWQDTRIIYDPGQTDPDVRFRWENINQGSKDELCTEMDDLVDSMIRLQALLVDVVWQALRHIENAVVVLTHVDLIDDILPSITFTDLERVYSYLFKNRPERMVSQQAVARLFHIGLANPSNTAGMPPTWDPSVGPLDGGPKSAPSPSPAPSKYAVKGLTQRLRSDGAIQLVEYLKSVASRGVEPAVIQVARLNQQLLNVKEELLLINKKHGDVSRDLGTTKAALESEHAKRLVLESDVKNLAGQINDKMRELETAQRNSTQSATRIAELSKDLDHSRDTSIKQLADEQNRHNETKSAAARSEDEVNRLKAQLVQLSGGTVSSELLAGVQDKLRIALKERDELTSKIVELESGRVEPDVDRLKAEILTLNSQLSKKEADWQAATARCKALEALGLADVQARDVMIEEHRGMIEKNKVEATRLQNSLAEARGGRISPDEARLRDAYEQGRFGAFKLWALHMVRALPALPFVAVVAWLVFQHGAGQPKAYWLQWGSMITLIAACLASLASVAFQMLQIPPRWIWLRSMSMTTPRTLDALTSGGERLNSAPGNFTLERSPLLSLLGIGMIRRNDSGQRYITTEPGAWLAAPERPVVRWLLMLDIVTIFLLAMWATLLVLGLPNS